MEDIKRYQNNLFELLYFLFECDRTLFQGNLLKKYKIDVGLHMLVTHTDRESSANRRGGGFTNSMIAIKQELYGLCV